MTLFLGSAVTTGSARVMPEVPDGWLVALS